MQLKSILLIAFISMSVTVCAQTGGVPQFISRGKIEYERKTNQHAFMDDNNVWDAMMKKNLPKFVTYYYDLSFDKNHSLYKPGREPDVKQNRY